MTSLATNWIPQTLLELLTHNAFWQQYQHLAMMTFNHMHQGLAVSNETSQEFFCFVFHPYYYNCHYYRKVQVRVKVWVEIPVEFWYLLLLWCHRKEGNRQNNNNNYYNNNNDEDDDLFFIRHKAWNFGRGNKSLTFTPLLNWYLFHRPWKD